MDPSENPRKGKPGKKKSLPAPSSTLSSPSNQPPGPPAVPTSAEARRAKIEKLKQSIADGTYRISDEEIARKLIEQMLEPKG